MKKKVIASCPISYRPTSHRDQQKNNLLGYIFSGYETCDSTELRDVCLQTDINMLDWDDQYFENIIERFTIGYDIGDSRPVEEFGDVIESGDEEFYSIKEDLSDEKNSDSPHSINIQLKDSPHIILEDGIHKTKISLTPKYLEENKLELIIGEGMARNVKLKAGDEEIYPSDKALPSGINISITDEKGSEKKDAEVDMSHEVSGNKKYLGSESPKGKLGLMSLVVDDLEQQNIERFIEEKLQTNEPGGNIVQCISDYGYLKAFDKREVGIFEDKKKNTLEKIHKEYFEKGMKEQVDPEMVRRQEKELYKEVKNKFFKSVLEGDPRLDRVKEELIKELVKKTNESPKNENLKNIEVQTDVHINPGAVDDFSFSDDSDSLLRRYYALRDISTLSSAREPSQTKHHKDPDPKKGDKSNTHEATMGQIDTDFSTRTEFTMEGISDLTERNTIGIQKEKEDATDDDLSDISTKPKKSQSITSIERRSKLIDTEDLDNEGIKDVAVISDRQLKSPSLIKALKSFDEELNPLQQELSRLLSDFKSIDIPEDVQISVATERLPEPPSTSAQPSSESSPSSSRYFPNHDESIHHLYRSVFLIMSVYYKV